MNDHLEQPVDCPKCHGAAKEFNGFVFVGTCSYCRGTGRVALCQVIGWNALQEVIAEVWAE